MSNAIHIMKQIHLSNNKWDGQMLGNKISINCNLLTVSKCIDRIMQAFFWFDHCMNISLSFLLLLIFSYSVSSHDIVGVMEQISTLIKFEFGTLVK